MFGWMRCESEMSCGENVSDFIMIEVTECNLFVLPENDEIWK